MSDDPTSRRARDERRATAIAHMNWVPLMSESPSFACSRTGVRPAAASASAPGIRAPSRNASPSPTSGSARWASGARSPLAPTDPRAGHVRDDPGVEDGEQQLDGLDPCARVSLRDRVRTEQHRGADDVVRVRLADPAGVAAKQAQLQLLRLVVRDRLRDEASESGVDAVGVLAAEIVEERPRASHPLDGAVRERDRCGRRPRRPRRPRR